MGAASFGSIAPISTKEAAAYHRTPGLLPRTCGQIDLDERTHCKRRVRPSGHHEAPWQALAGHAAPQACLVRAPGCNTTGG
eukprot:5098561-Amphidinium_carterae.1